VIPEAYEDGRAAAFDGKGMDRNPYHPDSSQYRQWLQGWEDARQELGTLAGRSCVCPNCGRHIYTPWPKLPVVCPTCGTKFGSRAGKGGKATE